MDKNYVFNKKKNVILYIFKYKCEVCGFESTQNHVHHIDKNHFNNDSFNLAVVCKNCHIFLHKNCANIVRNLSQNQTIALEKLNHFI